MSNLGPIGLIVLMGLVPFLLLGIVGAALSGGVAWKPVPLWTDQFGGGQANMVTSVAASTTGLFATGYAASVPTVSGPPASEFFLRAYDQTGHQAWTEFFGDSSLSTNYTPNRPAITVGTDGLYFTAAAKGGTQIIKFDLQGQRMWTILVPHANSTPAAISAGTGGVYVAGTAQQNNPSRMFVEKYDSRGTLVWSHTFANSSGVVKAVYAGSSGVYLVGWVVENLPGQTLHGTSDGFMVAYDENGNPVRTDEFAGIAGIDESTGVSGGGQAVYVTGSTQWSTLGFVRKYGLDGGLVKAVSFTPIGLEVFGSSIASDASGVYLFGQSSEAAFTMKYDSNLNQAWKLELPDQLASMAQTIAVGPGGGGVPRGVRLN
ncbi:MAG TPA: hypothetical protein VGS11_03515 [Candidatus Bathyarchaeia archaeon]|nr:hypothetical protein [Candidatus Bathyarchaeia archaeon]